MMPDLLSLPESSGVYLLTHRATGDTYVGSAKNIRARLRTHFQTFRLNRCAAKLAALVASHGADFAPSVLEVTPPRERVAAERRWIESLKPTLNERMVPRPAREPFIRINVMLPQSEREAFDLWCRFGTAGKPGSVPKVSMNRRIRQLLMADAAGKIAVPRTAPPETKE